MSAVDERQGVIARPEVRTFDLVKQGYTYFEEGDVLFAKITPCMQNGKHAVAIGLQDGFRFGSTEFHVRRPSALVLPQWIHYFIRQPSVLKAAIRHFAGAVGQQRIPASFLADLRLPLPPVSEQRRSISSLYEKMATVEQTRAAAEAQLAAAKALRIAYQRQIFEVQEARRWPKVPLGEAGEIGSESHSVGN